MANDDKILELLIQNTADTATTKKVVEDLSSQMSSIFNRIRSLEDYRALEKGKQQSQGDILGRILGVSGIIGSVLAAYLSNRIH
jgi:hypothetical protein